MTPLDVMLLVIWLVGAVGGGAMAGRAVAYCDWVFAALCLIPIGIGVAAGAAVLS